MGESVVMPADWTSVSGDTEPLLTDTLTFSSGEPANLEGATVTFVARALTSPEPLKLTGTVEIVKPTEGKVAFKPTAADTATPGNYMTQWKVVFAGGEVQTWPTVGYEWWQIQPNLTKAEARQLVSVGEVKDHLFIQPSDRIRDETLLGMIEDVAPLIENLTGPILAKRFDEWYEGGTSSIALRHRPSYGYGTSPIFFVQAVSEYRGPIEYNLALVPTPTQGSVYSAMGHGQLGTIVRRTSGGGTYAFWHDPSHPQQSVHVVYYVGQETVPGNVRRATLEAIRWWYETTMAVGRGSLTRADDEVLGKPLAALPYHAEAMLNPTKKHPSFA